MAISPTIVMGTRGERSVTLRHPIGHNCSGPEVRHTVNKKYKVELHCLHSSRSGCVYAGAGEVGRGVCVSTAAESNLYSSVPFLHCEIMFLLSDKQIRGGGLAGEVALRLRTDTALAEDLSLVLSTTSSCS